MYGYKYIFQNTCCERYQWKETLECRIFNEIDVICIRRSSRRRPSEGWPAPQWEIPSTGLAPVRVLACFLPFTVFARIWVFTHFKSGSNSFTLKCTMLCKQYMEAMRWQKRGLLAVTHTYVSERWRLVASLLVRVMYWQYVFSQARYSIKDFQRKICESWGLHWGDSRPGIQLLTSLLRWICERKRLQLQNSI